MQPADRESTHVSPGAVRCVRGPMEIKAYGVGAPEKNPMFFEKRVYQGSCGKVYPVPFID